MGSQVKLRMIVLDDVKLLCCFLKIVVTPPTVEPSLVVDRQYLFITNAHQEKIFQINTVVPPSTDALFTASTTTTTATGACSMTASEELAGGEQLLAPFTCLLSVSTTNSAVEENDNVFSVASVFNARAKYVNGQPACVISTKELDSAERKRLSVTNDRMLDLSVVLTDRVSRTEWRARHQGMSATQLRFTADVFVTTRELVLSKSQPFKTVDVFGSNSQLTSLKV